MEYIKDLASVLGILAAIAGLSLTTHTLISNKLSNRIKEYEIYKELSGLLKKGASCQNLASMLVALSCIISRELTLDEIRWFVQTPSAFRHIKDYSAQANYLKISDDSSGFSYKEKYTHKKTRWLEIVSLFGLYIVLGVIAAVIFVYGNLSQLQTPLLIFLYGFGAISAFLALVFLKLLIAFSDTKRMINKILIKKPIEPDLELITSSENKST
ncbi:hypothetical protein ACGMNB_19650 [Shewanella oncorhynchi]|uniref:hypothetical protein n=1 Tax=Shewanella oncorhynchi TaxID=2726434 RepID=UPI003745973F